MGDTRTKLIEGALEALRVNGIAEVSARTIATAAGVNQALIFYHFGTVDSLLAEACKYGAEQHVAMYRERFAAVTSLSELLDLGRAIHTEEKAAGNLAVLAQLLAAGQTDKKLAPATAEGLSLWMREIEDALTRLLRDTALAGMVDVGGLARVIAASFVGLELYEGVDEDGAARALDALEQLASLTAMLDDLGPVAKRVVRGRMRRSVTPSP